MKNYKKISLFTLLFILLLNIGFASWVIVNGSNVFDNNQIAEKENSIPVAYTYANNVKTQFTSIESALKHTDSGTVYVIPGANPIITSDCTIKTNVTLCIPFDDTDGKGGHTDYTGRNNQSGTSFSDTDAAGVTKYRKSLVTIEKGVTLTNNGTLEIGGLTGTGKGGQKPTGHTNGEYAELLMKDNSVLNNNGKINLYGYIKESSTNNGSKIIHSSGSNIKMPFVIYDFRGGSYSYATYSKDIMPFSNYDLPNCQVLQKFNYGSKIIGMLTLYAGDKFSIPEANILGTNADNDCLFKLSSGFVTMKYTPNDCLYTTNDVSSDIDISSGNFTYITVNGNIALSSIKISLTVLLGSSISIDSSKMYCPLDFKFQIEVESGTLNISNKMKFLSGSSLTIDEGATVNINANTTFYQAYVPKITTGGTNIYPKNGNLPAKLINNGTLNLNSSFGGFIDLSKTTGKIITGSNFSSSVTTTEALASSGSSIFASVSSSDDHNENAYANISYNNSAASKKILIAGKNYLSENLNNVLCWSSTVDLQASIIVSTTKLNANGAISTLTLSLIPDESFFDLTSINWTMSKDKSSYKDQTLIESDDKLSSTFKVINNPGTSWFGAKLNEHTYTISVKINKKAEYGGGEVTIGSVKITVVGWK